MQERHEAGKKKGGGRQEKKGKCSPPSKVASAPQAAFVFSGLESRIPTTHAVYAVRYIEWHNNRNERDPRNGTQKQWHGREEIRKIKSPRREAGGKGGGRGGGV